MTAAQRSDSLSRFRRGEATVMVASDAMTRGMDLENVLNVVNYDAPVYAKTYVHRAGRTARAGRFGRVFTLLRDEEVRHFKDMLRKADNNFVKDHKMKPEEVNALKPQLGAALAQVQELLALEQQQQQQQQALAAGGGGSVAAGRGSSATAAATRATGGGIGASNGNKQRGDATGPLADSPVEPRAKRAKSTGLS